MVEDEILETVRALNKAWMGGNIYDLPKFFHEEIVAITPMDEYRLEGKDACVASWARFVDNFKIKEWKEIDPLVQVFEVSLVTQKQFRSNR